MLRLSARQLAHVIELKLVNADLRLEDLGRQRATQLFDALIRRESLWLHLILIGLLIQREAVARYRSINRRAEVCILFDDIALLALNFHVFTCLVHFPKHFDSLPLDLGERPLLVLRLLEPYLFRSLSVLLLGLLFSLDQSRLEQIESLILQPLDVFLSLVPLAHLELFHELAPQHEARLIRCRR